MADQMEPLGPVGQECHRQQPRGLRQGVELCGSMAALRPRVVADPQLVRWRSSAGSALAVCPPHLNGSGEVVGPKWIELEAGPRHVEAAWALGFAPEKSTRVATP